MQNGFSKIVRCSVNSMEPDDAADVPSRILALLLEGLDASDVARMLRMNRDIVDQHVEELRVRLGVSHGVPVEEFVRKRFSALAARADRSTEPVSEADQERRVRLLLRLTFQELMRVADDADLRGAMLAQTVGDIGSADRSGALQEAEDLRMVAREIQDLAERLLDQIRNQ